MKIIAFALFVLIMNIPAIGQDAFSVYNGYFSKGDYISAAKEIDRLISEAPGKAGIQHYYYQSEVYYILYSKEKLDAQILKSGEAALLAINTNEKGSYYDKIQTIAGNIAKILYATGAGYYNKRDYNTANTWFLKSLELYKKSNNNSDINPLYYYISVCCKETGKESEAEKYLKILSDNQYKEENVYLYLSEIYKKRGEINASVEALKKGIQSVKSVNLYSELVFTLYQENQKTEALKYIQDFKTNQLSDFSVECLEGNIYMDMNNETKAVEAFSKVLTRHQGDFNIHYNLGIIFYNSGMSTMKNAEQFYYSDPDKYRSEKDIYIEKIKIAAVYLEKAMTFKSNDKNTVVCLLDIYKRLQRKKEEENLQKVLDIPGLE